MWTIHRLNMERDLQSLFGLLCTAVLIGWDPATPPSPRIWAHIRGRYLGSQDRRHLFVTPGTIRQMCGLKTAFSQSAFTWFPGHGLGWDRRTGLEHCCGFDILAGFYLALKVRCLYLAINQGEGTQPPSLLSPPGPGSVRLCIAMERDLSNSSSLPHLAS